MGIIALFLLYTCPPGSPEYLYRNLSIQPPGYAVVDVIGMTSNLIYWHGGTDVPASHYYESNGVDDDLYGFFSIPVREVGGQVIMDSIFLCYWTQGGEDYINDAIIYQTTCDGGQNIISIVSDLGNASSGWERANILADSFMVADSCYYIYLDCINNGANDIRVYYCMNFRYHLDCDTL